MKKKQKESVNKLWKRDSRWTRHVLMSSCRSQTIKCGKMNLKVPEMNYWRFIPGLWRIEKSMKVRLSTQPGNILLKLKSLSVLLSFSKNCTKIPVVNLKSYICWLIVRLKWEILKVVKNFWKNMPKSNKMDKLSMKKSKKLWKKWGLNSVKRKSKLMRPERMTNGWMWRMKMPNFKLDWKILYYESSVYQI